MGFSIGFLRLIGFLLDQSKAMNVTNAKKWTSIQATACFKVARGKLWEMFGDLNLGEFKCKALFSCADNFFFHGLIPDIF